MVLPILCGWGNKTFSIFFSTFFGKIKSTSSFAVVCGQFLLVKHSNSSQASQGIICLYGTLALLPIVILVHNISAEKLERNKTDELQAYLGFTADTFAVRLRKTMAEGNCFRLDFC